jgi:hypothetical protein
VGRRATRQRAEQRPPSPPPRSRAPPNLRRGVVQVDERTSGGASAADATSHQSPLPPCAETRGNLRGGAGAAVCGLLPDESLGEELPQVGVEERKMRGPHRSREEIRVGGYFLCSDPHRLGRVQKRGGLELP